MSALPDNGAAHWRITPPLAALSARLCVSPNLGGLRRSRVGAPCVPRYMMLALPETWLVYL